MNPTVRTLIVWIAIFVVVILLWNTFQAGRVNRFPLTFTEFLEQVEDGRVAEVTIRGQEVSGTFTEGGQYAAGDSFFTYLPEYPDLVTELRDAGVIIKAEEPRENPFLQFLFGWAPFILIIGLWFFFFRQMQAGGSRAFSFGKSKAKLLTGDTPQVTFADVAGADEAKDNQVVGKVPYMAPEVLTEGVVDARSDLYSLGLVVYELLTGCRPWGADVTPVYELERRICEDVPPPPASIALPESNRRFSLPAMVIVLS